MEILVTVGAVSAISGGLALLLVLAEMIFANYGECKIIINGKKELVVEGGGSLLSALAENKIFIPSACGGRGSCGFCKVQVHDGGGPLLPTEKPYLTPKEIQDNVRLSCQIKVKKDIQIQIPEDIFNIQKYNAVVKKMEDFTYDIKGVTFCLESPNSIDFKAGQYMQLTAPKYGKNKKAVQRAYSISSIPADKNHVQLIIRLVPNGICTTYVHEVLKEGDNATLTGPFGDFFIRDTDADIVFIAGGSGKAPIKSMLEDLHLKKSNRRMAYFFGARTQDDLYLTDYFYNFEKQLKDFTYYPILSHEDENSDWKGRRGYIPAHLNDFVTNPKNTEAYLCGSPGMIAAVEKSLLQIGIPKENIYYDSFA